MKYILIFISCFLFISCSRTITGVVHLSNTQKETASIFRDTVQRFNEFIGNLTLKEYKENNLDSDKSIEFILKNLVLTDKTGSFTINAQPKDSLYFKAYGYYTKTYSVKDLLKMKYIYVKLDEIPCDRPIVTCTDTIPKLHIVIAEKVKLKRLEGLHCKYEIPFDSKYSAKYRILENLYGDYKGDTITFDIYDHNGRPQFAEYDTVLLYIGEYCGELVHVRYQFSDLYKTVDGRWASPLGPSDYGHIKPVEISNYTKIVFKNPIKYPLDTGWPTPKEYFRTDDTNTYSLYGRYVEDIIIQMKETKLKKFGFFLDD